MQWLKRNSSWLLVCIFAILPLFQLFGLIQFNFEDNGFDWLLFDDYEFPEELNKDAIPGIEFAMHSTGEWAIRFLVAVLLCTPVRILLSWNPGLYVRQAIGISAGIYVLLHLFLFIHSEGFWRIFSEVELIIGFLAAVIVVALMLTSNRKSMKVLKTIWKKLHRFSYFAGILAVLHVALLKEEWIIYAILLGIGFVIRFQPVATYLESLHAKKRRM